MALDTHSLFYSTIEITESNRFINFDEGSGELTAELSAGLYSMEELISQCIVAVNAVSVATFSFGFNRFTRRIEILSTATFSLLTNTGSQLSQSAFETLGFTTGVADLTGQVSYTGDFEAGDYYTTQFKLQDYTAPGFLVEKISPSVNESASGEVETISFGDRQLIRFTLKYITNVGGDGHVIRANPSGVDDALRFLNNIIKKGNFEFMPDEDNPLLFYKVKLESTDSNGQGLGFLLRERVDSNLRDYYDVGPLTLRVLEEG